MCVDRISALNCAVSFVTRSVVQGTSGGTSFLKYIQVERLSLVNPVCHLLAFLGAHPILHFSRLRVTSVDKHSTKGSILIFVLGGS